MKAIILSRVSTQNQDLIQQTQEVLKFAKADGFNEADIEIIEDKESAAKLTEEQRLGLLELKQKILSNPGLYSCVYAYEISRIGRRAEVNYLIRNFLQTNRVQLVIIKPYIRLFDANFKIEETANMTFAIFNALAENEGYLRKERLARGKARRQNDGCYVGGHLPYGYTTDSDKKIIIDPVKGKLIEYIFDEYVNNNKSTHNLGSELLKTGELNVTTLGSAVAQVKQILHHVAYIGQKPAYRQGNRQAQNIYPRLIPDELFYAAQAKLQKNAKSTTKVNHKHVYYCKGLIKDPRNGRTLTPHFTSANYSSSYVTLTEKHNISIPVNIIDSFIWHLTQEYYKSTRDDKVSKMIADINKTLNILNKQIKQANKNIDTLGDKEKKIQERIISGKMNEKLGDEMLENIYKEQNQADQQLNSLKLKLQATLQRFRILTSTYEEIDDLDIFTLTDNQQRVKHIQSTIVCIELTKYDPDPKRKRGQPTGHFIVTYLNGNREQYFYNTYTHLIWDSEMNPIAYTYIKRITSINAKKHQNN